MAILLTGGAGYIGSHCYYALQKTGAPLIVLDDLSNGSRDLLPNDVCFYQGNVGSQQILDTLFKAHAIDSVFHFAGSVAVPESIAHPDKYYQNNTANSLTLLKACIKHKVKNFIFSSTAAVYAPAELLSENATLAPTNPYANSKRMTEIMIDDCHKAYGLNYAILRYFNVAGADANLRTGQPGKNATHLIKVACETLTGKRDYIPLFGTDYPTKDGTCIRDFIHVTDLSKAHLNVYEHMKKQQGSSVKDIFNCGYGHGYSVQDVLNAFNKVSEKPLPIKITSRRPGDSAVLIADAHLLREKTGWKPDFDNLETILTSALAWEQKCHKTLLL